MSCSNRRISETGARYQSALLDQWSDANNACKNIMGDDVFILVNNDDNLHHEPWENLHQAMFSGLLPGNAHNGINTVITNKSIIEQKLTQHAYAA